MASLLEAAQSLRIKLLQRGKLSREESGLNQALYEYLQVEAEYPVVRANPDGDELTISAQLSVDGPFYEEVFELQPGEYTRKWDDPNMMVYSEGRYCVYYELNLPHVMFRVGDVVVNFEDFDFSVSEDGSTLNMVGRDYVGTLTFQIKDGRLRFIGSYEDDVGSLSD